MRLAAATFGGLIIAVAIAPDEQPTIRADVNLVELQATVTDAGGHPVTGLGKDSFELFVDGVKHPITVFQGEDAPVSAGIVIDNSASMAPKRSDVIAAALAFARASNSHDQMFVVHFSTGARFGLPEGTLFTSNISELEQAVSQFHLGGTTALYDALMVALDRLEMAATPRKTLLVITDGGDNSSRAPFDDVRNAARRSEAALYAIGIFDAADRDRNPPLLTELAATTGGQAFFPATSAEVSQVCERIAAAIRLQYALGFAGAQDGKYHTIQLLAKDPARGPLTVHTRAGYFAAKPANADSQR
jgi:Ca-activated chloride channel homolog